MLFPLGVALAFRDGVLAMISGLGFVGFCVSLFAWVV